MSRGDAIMEIWKKQIDQLQIPFPQKTHLINEIENHVVHFPMEKAEILKREDLAEFYQIHNTRVFHVLQKIPPKLRLLTEFIFAGGPVTALLIYLAKEKLMFDFIRQGGAGMYVVLAIGAILLLKEIMQLQRVLVIKAHTKENLNPDSLTVLIGALALFIISIGATGIDAYWSVFYFEQNNSPISVLATGLKESVTCLIAGSLIAALILLMHFLIRRTLGKWKVPQNLSIV